MLRNIKLIEKYKVMATDAEIGTISDFYFDEEHWTIRYLVVDTGGILTTWRVLISPISFGKIDWINKKFHLLLTKEKVKNCPCIDLKNPISREHERLYYDYYGWPLYWGGSGAWGGHMYPRDLIESKASARLVTSDLANDSHVRGFEELEGFSVIGTDSEIGHVTDLIIDDETWSIRYLVLDTKAWWFGKKVLISPDLTEKINWLENKVYVNIQREVVKNSPEWKTDTEIEKEYETRLHNYYEKSKYPADHNKIQN